MPARMRLQKLRRILRNIIVTTLPAGRVFYGCPCPPMPPPTVETIKVMMPIDSQMQALIDACQNNRDCIPMCVEAMKRRDGVPPAEADISDCSLMLLIVSAA